MIHREVEKTDNTSNALKLKNLQFYKLILAGMSEQFIFHTLSKNRTSSDLNSDTTCPYPLNPQINITEVKSKCQVGAAITAGLRGWMVTG